MTQLQVLKSELEDNLELYDWVVNRIKEITNQMEQLEKEGEAV